MPILWNIITFFDLQNMLILIVAIMRYKDNYVNNFAEIFARMTAIINFKAMACFFKAIYYGILKYLLATGSKNREFFSLVFIYFGIVKIKNQQMFYLHCLV